MTVEPQRLVFLDLPLEIIGMVLDNLNTTDLCCLERVCQRLQALARNAYHTACGSKPLPRKCRDACDYRNLALERLRYHQKHNKKLAHKTPEDEMSELFVNLYTESNEALHEQAVEALLNLQESSDRGRETWHEAVAVALMAQGRWQEARPFYHALMADSKSLPANTILVAARWEWPFHDLSYPIPTEHDLLDQACIGAATSGNVEVLIDLHRHGAALDDLVRLTTPAMCAARRGHVVILKMLQDKGVNLSGDPRILWNAAKYGHYQAARYLLDLGAQPHATHGLYTSSLDIATTMGNMDILELFLTRLPSLKDALCMELVMVGGPKMIQSLVERHFLDIKTVDPQGLTALHFAVRFGDAEMAKVVIDLGVDVQAKDIRGQTAIEQATSYNLSIAKWLHEHVEKIPDNFRQQKTLHIRAILARWHLMRLTLLARESHINVKRLERAWLADNMEGQLIDLWIRHMSLISLEWYVNHIVGSRAEAIWFEIALSFDGNASIENNVQCDPRRAGKIAKALVLSDNRGQMEKLTRMIQALPSSDIHELEGFWLSREGQFFREGLKSKYVDEVILIMRFIARVNDGNGSSQMPSLSALMRPSIK